MDARGDLGSTRHGVAELHHSTARSDTCLTQGCHAELRRNTDIRLLIPSIVDERQCETLLAL